MYYNFDNNGWKNNFDEEDQAEYNKDVANLKKFIDAGELTAFYFVGDLERKAKAEINHQNLEYMADIDAITYTNFDALSCLLDFVCNYCYSDEMREFCNRGIDFEDADTLFYTNGQWHKLSEYKRMVALLG